MGTTCPSCGKDGFLYIVHDENIGHKLKKRGNRHKKEDKRHQRSGKSLNPDHTTGCGHELATNE